MGGVSKKSGMTSSMGGSEFGESGGDYDSENDSKQIKWIDKDPIF